MRWLWRWREARRNRMRVICDGHRIVVTGTVPRSAIENWGRR